MMTNGQPANQTMTPILYLIHSRSNGNISDGEIYAASILIMVIVGVLNGIVFALSNKKEKVSNV
jgi:ABC-type sugar transport system permease subunit